MKDSQHASKRKPQIVPRGYWTFWCVLSFMGGVGGLIRALFSGPEYRDLFAAISIAWGFAWFAVYWRIRRESKAA